MAITGPVPTRAQLLTLLRGFLVQVLPQGVEVVIAQGNRVPEPVGDNSVWLLPTAVRRLATTVETWPFASVQAPPLTALDDQQDVQAKVQLQVFGAASMDNLNIITTLLRSSYAVTFFSPGTSGIAPLHCDDGQLIPFTTGEDQYQDRWIADAMFEMSVVVQTPQQFADAIELEVVDIEEAYPP